MEVGRGSLTPYARAPPEGGHSPTTTITTTTGTGRTFSRLSFLERGRGEEGIYRPMEVGRGSLTPYAYDDDDLQLCKRAAGGRRVKPDNKVAVCRV